MRKYFTHPLFNLFLLLLIWLICTSTNCSKSTEPEGTGTDPRCGAQKDYRTTFYPSQSNPPGVSYLEGNTRVCGYGMMTTGICPYMHVFVSIYAYVDTSAVTEGMTISGRVSWGLFEENFTTTLTHNYNNLGISQFVGDTEVGLMAFAPDSAYCYSEALIKFPTKGSEAADLNYLYSKTPQVTINIYYNLWKPQATYY